MKPFLVLGLTLCGVGYLLLWVPYPVEWSYGKLLIRAIVGMAMVIVGSLLVGLYLFLKGP